MQRKPEETTICRRMEEQRVACEQEIRIQRERSSMALSSFDQSLHSIRSMADETLANREKLIKLKDYFKELEADLGKNHAVKSSKEAKYTAAAESLAATIDRTEQLKKIVQDQRARRNEYSAVISQQSLALENLEEKSNHDITERESIDEAITWYNRVLGFRTEGGEGVKFIFNKINPKNPDEEYSFTVRLDGDIYTLLRCDPHLEDISELVKELNKPNGLFKFVRIMREKFQVAVLNGGVRTTMSIYPDSSTIMVSSPPPTSVDSSSGTPKRQNGSYLQPKLRRDHPQKGVLSQVSSPSQQSISALRRSPRLKAKEFA